MTVFEVTNVDFSLRHFLLPLMRGVRAAGHEVVGVCADGALLDEVRAEGFRVESLPLARSLSPVAQARAFLALYRLFRAEKPDLVHAHMPISGFLARLAARAAGVPCVAYTCHGFLFNQPGPWLRRAAAFAMEFLAGRLTGIFLTVSSEEAEDARRLRIHPAPRAVGNGRDPRLFRPDPQARAALRASLGVPQDRVVVTALSRLVRHKGYPELLSAMRDVPAGLWVVGTRLASDHGEDLAPYFASCGLGERLRMLGYRTDVAALPMSVIEAMLCGLPGVATDIRGPREQVVDGETGFLVPAGRVAPLADALARLARDKALRARMGGAGRARALAQYREDVVLERTLAALGLSFAGPGRP